MKKFDNWLYAKVTQLVRRWVKKNKFEKHKIDLILILTKVEMGIYIGCGIFLGIRESLRHHPYYGGLLAAIWIGISMLDLLKLRTTQELKDEYDTIWMLRKHPEVHEGIRLLCERTFERGYSMRSFMLPIYGIFSLLQVMLISPVVLIFLFGIANMYIVHVFDFDEPDQTKKAKDSVTELVKNKLKALVERVIPAPMPSPQGV